MGLDKTHWSSSIAMDGEKLWRCVARVLYGNGSWSLLGLVIEPGAHSGGAVRHRTQKASSIFSTCKPLLCNPNLSLKEKMKAFGAKTLSSATCLSGCWTLSKQQEQASESWCARLLSQMVGFKRDPNDDFATFWKKLHLEEATIWPEFSLSAQLISTFVRNTVIAGHFCPFRSVAIPVYQMLVCRNLAWWRQEQRVWGKTKFGGAHPQRFNVWRWETCLERAYGCTRLERGGDPRAVGWTAVAQNKCLWKAGEGAFSHLLSLILSELACQSHGVSATCGFFFLLLSWTAVRSPVSCVGEAGPRLLSGHARFT